MTQSMTGFASARGKGQGHAWRWEMRSVNGRGLDIRPRVPDWIDGLETEARKRIGAAFTRGSIAVSLRTAADRAAAEEGRLAWAFSRVAEVEAMAEAQGRSLVPCSATDILALRPEADEAGEDTGALRSEMLKTLDGVIADLRAAREAEGAALVGIVAGQLEEVEALAARARDAEKGAVERRAEAMCEAMERVLKTAKVDEARLEQELALIAVKADVAEELDRLDAHVEAGRALLTSGGPVGRKLDFLTQELNREANTLCSKSSAQELTAVGLELKATIDRMREQVQNVE